MQTKTRPAVAWYNYIAVVLRDVGRQKVTVRAWNLRDALDVLRRTMGIGIKDVVSIK